jgi:hypothetical protein
MPLSSHLEDTDAVTLVPPSKTLEDREVVLERSTPIS